MTRPDGTPENGAGRPESAGPGAGQPGAPGGPAADAGQPGARPPFGANRFARNSAQQQEEPPVVIRDKRRVDQQTGGTTNEVEPELLDASGVALAEATTALAERTADLQRLQAEYANYRKRADRERQAAGEVAIGSVLAALLPVLDDIERARQHGDLTGAFKSVADGFDTVLAKVGLVAFGDPGDPFDPSIHEAVLHDEADTVDVPTATTIMRPGYKYGERLVRPAMVGVTDPSGPPRAAEPTPDALADDAEDIGI